MNQTGNFFAILFIILLTLTSCDRAFENGELDGMWRLERVTSDEGDIVPQDIYYSFQRHIVMFGKYFDENMPQLYMGVFTRTGSQLKMEMFKEYPGIDDVCDAAVLESFCIYNPEGVVFDVLVLNDETLVMQSEGREYYFRKW